MESLHYFFVVLSILIIIGIQFRVFYNTQKKIRAFKQIFPASSGYKIGEKRLLVAEPDADSDDSVKSVYVSQIQLTTKNATMKAICSALNMYLEKNKGAASDFNLMKDVVERYCDADEEEINIQQPIPLYLGLMGTMIGIIIGIGFLALNGGLSEGFQMEHISSLMTCVAIAMGASLVGIVCTTMLSWNAKNATSKVEADKNIFYSWLQTELLPVLSGNAVNALYLLQQNLMAFNQTFQSHIAGLDATLSKVESVSQEQVELIGLIKDIDVRRVAQANISVLRELRGCTAEITVFNQYLHNVSGYLNAVNGLNASLNEHLDRTAAIEKMGAFFEREINQVKEREQYINAVVADVDDTLRKTFTALSESTRESIKELKNKSVAELDALTTYCEEQRETFKKMLQAQREEWASRPDKMEEVLVGIRQAMESQSSVLEHLLQASKEQMQLVTQVVDEVKKQSASLLQRETKNETPETGDAFAVQPVVPMEFPKTVVYLIAAIAFMVLVAVGIYIYNSFFGQSAIV